MSISKLCISVALSTSWTDFTVNSKFSANRGSLPLTEALNKAFLCRLFSVSCKQDASGYEQNTPEYTYQRNETVSPWELDRLFFHELPKEIQSKIVYIYSVIDEYSLRSRDVHSTPSWPNWSDFEYRLWCLAIVVRTPPARHRKCERFRRIVLFKFFDFYFKNRDLTNLLFGRGPNRVLEMACFDPKVQ